ncbi:MAG: hypothetical protein ACD_70C00147G0003, partial [uncultured bacterium]
MYTNPIQNERWRALNCHYKDISKQHMRDWFKNDSTRFSRYSFQVGEILFDYSRNRINDETLALLCELAESMQLSQKITHLFAGDCVNRVEKRPALHTALRDQAHHAIEMDGVNIDPLITETLNRMEQLTDQLHSQALLGVTGKPIITIVVLGVGGSSLGAEMCYHALKDFRVTNLQCHFVSSIDKTAIQDLMAQINPETTMFIVASKTFKTLETLTNFRFFLAWMRERLGEVVVEKHFIAITANLNEALTYRLPKQHIFPIWNWVGGRYSIWSAMGLPLMFLIGCKAFHAFLVGAFEMDQHFRLAPFSQNMPVLLALLSLWYVNFFRAHAHAVVPYSYRLRYLTTYLQQMSMESNGKSTNIDGECIDYFTGPVIFGNEGCHGQHAYHQLLHQGQHLIPVDFILTGKLPRDSHHDMLVASGLSQALALMSGKTHREAERDLLAQHYSKEEAAYLAAHQVNVG